MPLSTIPPTPASGAVELRQIAGTAAAMNSMWIDRIRELVTLHGVEPLATVLGADAVKFLNMFVGMKAVVESVTDTIVADL